MLEAAETLLNASPDRDIATRAVCEAVGVGAPVLYRIFGDKNGLLSAVVDYGFERYLSTKRAAAPSKDPVVDLRDGWDTHVAFALEHPAVYRLMYSPSFAAVPGAADEAMKLLRDVLERCAEAGRMRVDPAAAAQAIMSANIGVSLALVTQPQSYTDPGLSDRVRDAVHAQVLTGDVDHRVAEHEGAAVAVALQLSALLRHGVDGALTEPETALLRQWLARLAAAGGPAVAATSSDRTSPGAPRHKLPKPTSS
jgi:AcrR family transcriptional regulator